MGRALNVIGVPTGAATFTAALEGLTALDQQILRENPGLPSLYEAGVSYTAESTSKWRNVLDCIKSKNGDCEALAPWRAAELRETGEDPGAHVLVYPSGTSKFHAVVLKSDGTIEDPSVLLGMKAPPNLVENYNWWNREVAPRIVDEQPRPPEGVDVLGFDDENVACVGILEDHAAGLDVVTFDVIRTPEGFRGQFRFPFLDGRALYGLSSTSASEGEAERKATAVLGFVGSVWDDLEALAPGPQSLAVLHLARNQHVQNLAKSAYGKAKSVVRPSSSSAGPAPRRRVDPSMMSPDAAASLEEGYYQDTTAPTPFDDQQPVADVYAFHMAPPGGYDPELAPELQGLEPVDHEGEVIGWINAALVSGSRPARTRPSSSRGHTTTTRPARPSSSSTSSAPRASAAPASDSFGYTPAFGGYTPAFGGGGGGASQPGAQGARGARGGDQGQAGGRGGYGPRGGQPGQPGRPGGQQQSGQPGQGRFSPGDPRDPRNQQQQQGGGSGSGSGSSGGGDSGGGGSGAPTAAPPPIDPDAFFAMGPGGQEAFYETAQLAQQIDQFEGNAPGDGYAGPDAAGDAAADAFAAEGQGMTDQAFREASDFARQAYQQEAGG